METVPTESSFERSVYTAFFDLISKDGNNVDVRCKLCPPAKRTYRTSANSTSNLKKHLQVSHPSAIGKLSTLKRKAVDTGDEKTAKKSLIQPSIAAVVKGSSNVTQSKVDGLIIDFVVNDMQSFSIVEQPSFVNLVTGLQPGKTVMSRKTLVERVEKQFVDMKENLIETLASVWKVCTTADVWSHHNRSFFGVTVHWIDSDTLQRKSAALSCCKIEGRHTYDLLASTLEGIHVKFNIDRKVCSTTTDNGSNFVKAFAVFQAKEESQSQTTLSQAEDGEVVFSSVTDVLNQSGCGETYSLPPHLRCAAHTLNLVAVHDIESACNDAQYKKIMRATMAKCSAAWNKASRSTQAAEVVRQKCNLTFIVPNATRWNSTFYAMERIHRIATEADGLLNQICEEIGVPVFRPVEITFIGEYIKAVQPLATALDILQAELRCFMGIMIPTIVCLKNKLIEVRKSVTLVVPLVDALLKGIGARFDHLLERSDLILASIVHPQFRLRWMESEEQKLTGKALLLEAMREVDVPAPAQSEAESSPTTTEDSFFEFKESAPASISLSSQMEMYLADPSREISSLNNYSLVKKIFLNTNTALPSSAPVERLFSLGGQVLTARRNRLNDEHLEMLVLLRANRNL